MMDVDFVQRIMREKSYPLEKVSSPKTGIKGKQRRFRNKYNPNNGKNEKDPRDLLATVNDQFNDPEYLNEIGLHLKEDIEKIKKEVIPLRQRLQIYMKMEEKAENLPPEAVTLDLLDPQPAKNVDVSQRANQLNIAVTELDSQLNTMQKYYCEKTKIDLKDDISIHQEKISDLNGKIDCMNEAIRLQNTQKEEIMNSKIREKIDRYNEKINNLNFLLNEMKEEQQEDIDHHFAIVCQREADPALQNQLATLQRQLNSLQYIKAQRQVELNKQMKRYEVQKKSVSAVIERHIQSSKNSSRNAKMSKRFTRELNNDYRSSRESKKRVNSQSSSSSGYSNPENEQENIYRRRFKYQTNKNSKKYQLSDEQSDIYYLEDAEVQTKEIDFNSLVNANFGSDPEKGLRFRHHRRRIRKHPKRDQPNSAVSQDDDIDEEMEINYDFPTNIQFLQFPSSRRKEKLTEQGKTNKKEHNNASIELVDTNKYLTGNTKQDENNDSNLKPEIEITYDIDTSNMKSCPPTNPTSNDITNNLNTTATVFQEETINPMPNHQALSQPVTNDTNNETDIDISISIQEIPTNNLEEKAKTFPFNEANLETKDDKVETNETITNDNVLDTDTDNDTNNSGIRISASFAENAINILGHSKFVSDNEEEEFPKELINNDSMLINFNAKATTTPDVNENKQEENTNLNYEITFPRPRDFSIPNVIQKTEAIPDIIEEEDVNDNSRNDGNSYTSIYNNLPCPSLSMKGSCCLQTVETGS